MNNRTTINSEESGTTGRTCDMISQRVPSCSDPSGNTGTHRFLQSRSATSSSQVKPWYLCWNRGPLLFLTLYFQMWDVCVSDVHREQPSRTCVVDWGLGINEVSIGGMGASSEASVDVVVSCHGDDVDV